MSYLFRGSGFTDAQQNTAKPYEISSSGAVALDLSNGAYQRIRPTTSTTEIVVSDTISSLTDGTALRLEIVQPDTGSCTVNWGASVIWPGATAPTLATTADNIDIIDFVVATFPAGQYVVARHIGGFNPPYVSSIISNNYSVVLGDPGTTTNTTQYLEAASSSVLSLDVDAPFSFSFWLKMPYPHAQTVEKIITKQAGSTAYNGYEIWLNSGKMTFGLIKSATSASTMARIQTTSSTLFNDEKWHHVACVFVDTSTDPLIYVDGVAEATSYFQGAIANLAGETIVNSVPFQIGGAAGLGSLYRSTSWIDEVSVWSKALSATNVADMFHAGSPGIAGSLADETNLDAWWRFGDDASDDFTGTTGQITDQTSNNRDLTPFGTTSANKTTIVPGIRHWYQCDAGVSAPIPDDGKVATGSSVLTLLGSPTSVALGNKAGNADCISFDGASDGAYCTATASLVADTMTWTMWLKINSTGNYEHYFSSSKNSFGGTGGGVGLYWVSSKLYFWTNNYSHASYVTAPSTGSWHHVACCLDIASNTKKIYLDGSVGTDYAGTNTSPTFTFGSYRFGLAGFYYGSGSSVSYQADCDLSDVRVYDRLLSASDVAQLYQSGSGDWP